MTAWLAACKAFAALLRPRACARVPPVTLHFRLPLACAAESAYAVDVLVGEFLGLPYTLEHVQRETIEVTGPGPGRLVLDASFFLRGETAWLSPETLPTGPLRSFDAASLPIPLPLKVPVLYGATAEVTVAPDELRLGLDLLGSAFFMLSRYEEVANPVKDAHGRFPATASTAHREGFLDRPIVNEYLEILWHCLRHLWPGLARRERSFRLLPTHDMDHPLRFISMSPLHWAYHSARFVAAGGAGGVPARLGRLLRICLGNAALDPFNTVPWILDESDRRGLRSAFYFFGGREDPHDARYEITAPAILALMRQIHDRGHELGLHPSYLTYLDPRRTADEAQRLRAACETLGITQPAWGGRQHYLRWQTPQTARNWQDAGLAYDSTLSFADAAGFRCGVCYEFPLYDVQARQPLRLRERPLVAMECSVIDSLYMGLGTGSEALAYFKRLKDQCRRFDGDFVLLWHNTRLLDPAERALYLGVLDA